MDICVVCKKEGHTRKNHYKILGAETTKGLTPDWIKEVCMYDSKQNALVISPMALDERGISNIIITRDRFGTSESMKIKTNFYRFRGKKVRDHLKESEK